MITLSQVTKTYAKNAKKAVDGLTLEVKSGELFGFIGPNGAGKTTTIKLITGIRGSGKSSLMDMLADRFAGQGMEKDQIYRNIII